MRRSNSFARFFIARKPKHGEANGRKIVGNSLFPTSLTDNELLNRGFGTPPPAGPKTPPLAGLRSSARDKTDANPDTVPRTPRRGIGVGYWPRHTPNAEGCLRVIRSQPVALAADSG